MIYFTRVLIRNLNIVYGIFDVVQINDLFFAFKERTFNSLLFVAKRDYSDPAYCNIVMISESMPTYMKLPIKTISMKLSHLIIKRIRKEKILFKGI